jgi:hypothetical protein
MNSAAAVARGIKVPYAGFPLTQTVFQALRPFPQFAALGTTPATATAYDPMGKTWYDSLQFKATKRLSYGLSFGLAYTWSKNLTLGGELEPNFGTETVLVNDVFNRQNSKNISLYDQPQALLFQASYITPRTRGNKILSWAARDWTVATFLAYRSGQPLQVPSAQSTPSLSALLGQSTFANRVSNQPLFTVDLNCHCYDPRNVFVLNKDAWANPAAGTFGSAAEYYNDYRAQRRPTENFNIGRTFRITERVSFNIRGEFTNIFNRTFIADVGQGAAAVGGTATINNLTNATAPQVRNLNGTTSGGFGALLNLAPIAPRQGNLVARITF